MPPAPTTVTSGAGGRTPAAADRLREKMGDTAHAFRDETDPGLLIEMFSAYALTPGNRRWTQMPAVRGFLEVWRAT